MTSVKVATLSVEARMGIKLSIAIGVLACAMAYGCGDDDDASAGSCPTDAKAGDKVSCHCGDAGTGLATCKNDGKLGACMCDGDGGTAGSGSSGSGGKSGSGTAGNAGSSASGSGASGNGSDEDGGVADEDAGRDRPEQMPPMTAVPTDGNQFTACTKDRDCNRNLGCYSPDMGGFCSAVCDRDEDCADLKPTGYHCSMTGLCAKTCMNADDDAACAPGMECTEVVGGGGGGSEFRCLYPTQMTEPRGAAFAECQGGGGGGTSCMEGLMCVGAVMGSPGFCTHNCTPADSDCSDVVPAPGTLSASCVPQNPELGTCALDCEASPDGCPDGMQCVETGFYHVCRYMN
jgi:hypothetical protein